MELLRLGDREAWGFILVLRPLSSLLFLLGDGEARRPGLLSLSLDLERCWKVWGLPTDGARPEDKELEEEGERLGGLGDCGGKGFGVGLFPMAALAWRVISVSPGGRFSVVVIKKPGNCRDEVRRKSSWDSKLVTIRIIDSFVISVCNFTDSTTHWPKAEPHFGLIKYGVTWRKV